MHVFMLLIDCSEVLYMVLLSDGELVGSCQHFQDSSVANSCSSTVEDTSKASAATSSATDATAAAAATDWDISVAKCGFFATSEKLSEATDLLSITVWDQPDRVAIMECKGQLQQMAGIHVDQAAAAKAVAAAAPKVGALGTKVADEHDSYEALVREAGIICRHSFAHK